MTRRDLDFHAAFFRNDRDPVHIDYVRGVRLRFFTAPTPHPRPWLSTEDLFDMLGTPSPSRQRLVRIFQDVAPDGTGLIWSGGSPVHLVDIAVAHSLVGFCSQAAGVDEHADSYGDACDRARLAMRG